MNEKGFEQKGDLKNQERERKEWKRILHNALQSGTEHVDRMAFHGTSVEAFNEIMKTGVLPGRPGGGGAYLFNASDSVLSAYLLDSKLTPRPDECQEDEQFANFLIEEASVYAENFAQEHHIFRKLGRSVPDVWKNSVGLQNLFHGNTRRSLDIDIPRCTEAASILGCTLEEICNAIRESVERRGVIIVLSRQLFNDLSYIETHSRGRRDADYEVVIRCPEGIPARYICGLEPNSRAEWNEIEKILDG